MQEQLVVEVSGRVEGVNFRTAVEKLANSLNVNGYVESIEKDTIKIVAQGERDKLEELLNWAQRGTLFAKINGMSYKFEEIKEDLGRFGIKTHGGAIKDKLRGIKNLGRNVKEDLVDKKQIKNVPRHIAIIPDGNRRWAREKNWHPWAGHLSLTKNKSKLMDIFEESHKLGIEYVTFWAFSTENWKRNDKEVEVLFNMMRKFKDEFLRRSMELGIRFTHIGRRDRLPKDIIQGLDELAEETKENSTLNIQFAIDYGGRDEIIRAFNRILESEENVQDIDENILSKYLDTDYKMPDPDMIIRTGGNQRTSGMMIWQAHYAELYFTNVLFPDFDSEHLRLAVLDYSHRIRRFGGDNKKDVDTINIDELKEPEELELAKLALT